MHPLTVFHDVNGFDSLAVSCKDEQGRRTFVCYPRPRSPHVVCVRDDGTRSLHAAAPVAFEPAYGQRIAEARWYPVVMPWRVTVPAGLALPDQPPEWLVEVLLFVWGDQRRLAALHVGGTTWRFDSAQDALDHAHRHSGCDLLYLCTTLAVQEFERYRTTHGAFECSRRLPLVCVPDDFVRVTALGEHYRQPAFSPRPDDVYSESRLGEICAAYAEHRQRWLAQRDIPAMMFALARITGLPLHAVASPRQTELADALIECTWAAAPLDFPPPEPVPASVERDQSKFRGASVLDAVRGIHYCRVLMPDVGSLYPNVVREFLADEYPLYARVFEIMLRERATAQTPDQAAALKVCGNSVFGSRTHGRYPDRRLAELIAEYGRRVQQESLALLAGTLPQHARVLAGDTDSLALWLHESVSAQTLVATLNGQRIFTRYKPDVDAFVALLLINNKSWAGLRADGSVVTRGLMQNRSITPRFVVPAHREWIHRLLTERAFAANSALQDEWIQQQRTALRAQAWSAADLACHPKPTADHPGSDRAQMHLFGMAAPVALCEYVQPGRSWPPVDIDYLLRVYFTDELARHLDVLRRGPAAA